MQEAVIVSAARTPIGSFGGALSKLSAVTLGTCAAKEAIKRAGIKSEQIEETIIGNILSAGLGQNIARQVSLQSGVSTTAPALSINMLCGSGLRAVILAAQAVETGEAELVLAGGTESMSRAPYLLDKYRWGGRMGDGAIEDSMVKDALTDAFHQYHMGITAENMAERWTISRERQDAFALNSQQKTEAAQRNGWFDAEIVPVEVPEKKQKKWVRIDEHPRAGLSLATLGKLRPAFKDNGTVTVGNASGINDGAAMLVVASRRKAEELGLPILAAIRSYANVGVDPAIMGYGPVPAMRKALTKQGLSPRDIDLFEINEAFAAQSLVVLDQLELDPDKVNCQGGAIALGHPVGASGARILVTLLYSMRRTGASRGAAALCVGGGQGTAMIVEQS
ncbi:acetyl-CoA C-acetyltransferase [Sporolactobacillus spathodeae]|uniref:acetyl-CoA C-acetyltransferase n=1 Tax=Sporolactobacillus spathodeae TaxID=1465502 RepID=A0ABS2Q895_9BACL|nr:acetyl-CoA C-acetyltransferase [Sporolactobacillus spathodeae]MBM7657973.1 acetyl-CoA C-acetyltransferase [Sporolactobacillus spathodeae]